MFEDIAFRIHTHNRIDRQITWDNLPNSVRKKTKFVVYPKEFVAHKKKFPGKVIKCDCQYGLAYKRQWIIENTKEEFLFLFDDDCHFYFRNEEGKLKKADKKAVEKMFILICDWLRSREVAQVGMSFRALNFTIKEDYKEVQQVYSIWGINRKLFLENGLRCDHARSCSDMQVTLGLLSKGFKNRVSYKYAVSQVPGTGGGCSAYRDHKEQKESVLKVHNVFPLWTKVYRRKKKDGWRDWDLKAFFKKCYNDGVLSKRTLNIRRFI